METLKNLIKEMEEAALARNKKVKEVFGDYAYQNKIQ